MTRVLVILLAVLFVPIPISAQCAWVLWTHTTINSLTPPYERVWWTIATSAVESAAVCQKMKKAAAHADVDSTKRTKAPNVESVEVVGDELVITKLKSGGNITTEHLCLPDTIDPRPR